MGKWSGGQGDGPLRPGPGCRWGRPERLPAFRLGPLAWGLQFHVEVSAAIVEDWLARWGADAERAGASVARIREETALHLDGLRARGARLVRRFAALVRDEAPGAASARLL